ncbi:hypothetical protein SEA_CHEWYVIII_95 [Rhodococcus phage ChewyVIII]|uniref:Uncharacterized protein n=1 Tax=Rhodococcus phage ChewyVIII TaxID=1887657 RepID=A0A1C9EID6_9CAUD|nr:hypothetical protein QEH30_gp95 [Rhodococcus phage ChewyVIII]AON97515.1 hypothetical protein SEA_CHEWYVIII_95 [Rhodococcus phage ChewyVIII]
MRGNTMNAYRVTASTGTEFLVMAHNDIDAGTKGKAILDDGANYLGDRIVKVSAL